MTRWELLSLMLVRLLGTQQGERRMDQVGILRVFKQINLDGMTVSTNISRPNASQTDSITITFKADVSFLVGKF